MISLSPTLPSVTFLSLKPPPQNLRPSFNHVCYNTPHGLGKLKQRRSRNGPCRAVFSDEVPFTVAIGACILNSLVFPITSVQDDDDDGDSGIDSTDTRLAVMAIISFIPYFNWLGWIFAWLDTGNRRYAVYAIVYLAPYLRSNLSLSPEESWLPIASIIFCIIHIQLEASIKNGDLQGFQIFRQAAKPHLKGHKRKSDEEEGSKSRMDLPASKEETREEIRGWDIPRKSSEDPDYLNEDRDASGGKKP